jgi:hypothetical protein
LVLVVTVVTVIILIIGAILLIIYCPPLAGFFLAVPSMYLLETLAGYFAVPILIGWFMGLIVDKVARRIFPEEVTLTPDAEQLHPSSDTSCAATGPVASEKITKLVIIVTVVTIAFFVIGAIVLCACCPPVAAFFLAFPAFELGAIIFAYCGLSIFIGAFLGDKVGEIARWKYTENYV